MEPPKLRILIFSLGSLQVFSFQTQTEQATQQPYKEVYWQDLKGGNVYGPFPSVHETMKHYTWTIENQKADAATKLGQVIHVNFMTKKRVVYA